MYNLNKKPEKCAQAVCAKWCLCMKIFTYMKLFSFPWQPP